MKVLIVDDDSFVCNGLRTLIDWDELGAEVIGEARNGEDAFNIAMETHPDLIISDIKMPVMDGMELCRKVKESMTDTFIILLSGYEDFNYACSAIKYGVRSYILKPINRAKINQLIDEIKKVSLELQEKKNYYSNLHDDKLEKVLFEALKQHDIEYVEEVFKEELVKYKYSNNELKSICLRMINILFDYMEKLGVNSKSLLSSKSRIMEDFLGLKTISQIEEFTQQLYFDVLQDSSKKKDQLSEGVCEFIRNYIEESYSNPDLSLFSIADKMNLSRNHLSGVFRQAVGINMSTYITNTRIKKAKELLGEPSLMISEIATIIGYQDSHYFARVFKKETGVNPTEYRSLMLNSKE